MCIFCEGDGVAILPNGNLVSTRGFGPATKLKRQWVHHEPATGRIIVCTAHDLKPGS